MQKTALICIAFLSMIICAPAQDEQPCDVFHMDLDSIFAEKATEAATVTMDANTLQYAGNFLNKNNPDEAQARKLISNLRGLCVRSFEYETDGQYDPSALEAVRSDFLYNTPEWSHMVEVRSKRDRQNVDVFLRMEKGAVIGVVIIASAPREVTLVYINGAINLSQLAELGGQLGIPKIKLPSQSKPPVKSESK